MATDTLDPDYELDQTIRMLDSTARDTPDPYDDAALNRVWRKQLRHRSDRLRRLREALDSDTPIT